MISNDKTLVENTRCRSIRREVATERYGKVAPSFSCREILEACVSVAVDFRLDGKVHDVAQTKFCR